MSTSGNLDTKYVKAPGTETFRIVYKKLNGRTVKRKIDVLTKKDKVLVGWDHKRKAIRSFKHERIKSMDKIASFIEGFEKRASHVADLAGLGVLAAPSIASLSGKPWKEKTKDKAEVAGLGILAAPSAYALGKNLLKRI